VKVSMPRCCHRVESSRAKTRRPTYLRNTYWMFVYAKSRARLTNETGSRVTVFGGSASAPPEQVRTLPCDGVGRPKKASHPRGPVRARVGVHFPNHSRVGRRHTYCDHLPPHISADVQGRKCFRVHVDRQRAVHTTHGAVACRLLNSLGRKLSCIERMGQKEAISC
jgi:hypothetical protein